MAFAASTAPRDAKRQGGGEIVAYRMVLSTTIYKGDIVFIDKTNGLVSSYLADASIATGDMFAGVASETKTAAAAGVTYINCYVTGVFEFVTTETAAVGDIGELIFADGSATGRPFNCLIGTGDTHEMPIGICVDFPTTASRKVRIDGYAANSAAAASVAP